MQSLNHYPLGAYMVEFNERSPLDKPCVAVIVRSEERSMTSAMLGELNGRRLATLGQTLDVALATLEIDGEVTVKFPRQREV